MIYQNRGAHAQSWLDILDVCDSEGYGLWTVNSDTEWNEVTDKLDEFPVGYDAIPIGLRCDDVRQVEFITCMIIL